MLVQAIGGAVAVVVGVHMMNSAGTLSLVDSSFGSTSVTNSVVVFNRSRVTNGTAVSVTDNSLGSSSVFGGAFAILQSPQVSNFMNGVLLPSVGGRASGFNFTVLISNSHFLACSVLTSASSSQRRHTASRQMPAGPLPLRGPPSTPPWKALSSK